ncbi:hypothetical protein HY488_03095 [Candidatus Woesearchaeota archaeon]|nr:hypothetical protein [Candidatus Woesearchaeota archaeon]
MSQNLLHKIESKLFQRLGAFTFLTRHETDKLLLSLIQKVKNSGYAPEVVVGIMAGGGYPARAVADALHSDYTSMDINHYRIKIGKFEIDELVGVYRFARLLGYTPRVTVERDVEEADIAHRRVLIVDDDSYSGATLETAIKAVADKNPSHLQTAVLHSHEANPYIDFAGKLFDHETFYFMKYRFPWSKISPYCTEFSQQETVTRLVGKGMAAAAE